MYSDKLQQLHDKLQYLHYWNDRGGGGKKKRGKKRAEIHVSIYVYIM